MKDCPACHGKVENVTMPTDPRRVFLCLTLSCAVGYLYGAPNAERLT